MTDKTQEEQAREYADGYQAGLAADRWIDVSEKLPEVAGRYLVMDERMVLPFVCDYYVLKGWDCSTSKITYWAIIPAAPKEEKCLEKK